MKKQISIFFLLISSIIFAQNPRIDSLKKIEKQLSGAEKAKVQADLTWFLAKYNIDSSLYYGNKAAAFYNGVNDTLLSDVYNCLGYAHARNGLSERAVEYYQKALTINEKLNYRRGISGISSHLSILYKNIKQYELALQYGLRCLKISRIDGDKEDEGIALNTLGTIYYRQNNYGKALETHLKALEIRESIGNKRWIASSLGSIGNTLSKLERNQESVKYYRRALSYFETLEEDYEVGNTLANIASAYLKTEQYDSAKMYLNEAELHANNFSDLHLKNIVFGLYEDLFAYQGDYKSAYEWANKTRKISDSLVNQESSKKISELEVRYQTEQKEKKLALTQLELAQKESALETRKWVILLLLILSLAIIFLALFVLQRNKRKAQAEKDYALILERDKGIQAVINAQEDERKRISKDLHDGVGQQLSGLKMAFQTLSSELKITNPEKEQELEKLSQVLHESADEVRTISHQMMPKALTELGIVEAIQDMLDKGLGNSNLRYEFEHFGIHSRLNEKVELSIYRICQELINNIIKHSKATKVSVQLFRNKDKLILIVEDNGVGIQEKNTQDGQGLLNIKSRLNPLSGEVNFEPSPQSGTIATVRIPIL